MRKWLFTWIIGCSCVVIGFTQAEVLPVKNAHQIAIKYYPSFLLDISGPSLEGGIEYRLNDKWAIQQDFGYITTWNDRYFLSAESMDGFRFRTSLRRYNWGPGYYHAITFGYKRVNRQRQETFCRDGCAYFQDYNFNLITNDFSAHYLFGWKSSRRLGLIDLNLGPGFRVFKRSRDIDLPEDAFASGINRGLFQIAVGEWLPTLSVILSVSVGIGK